MWYLSRTPVRTFIVYPILTLIWELSIHGSDLGFHPYYLLLMLWGYLQYGLCGRYRFKRGGGGPGLENPPHRLVLSGPYAYTRNPMYLGHIIFLTGLTLTLRSWFAAIITVTISLWFHFRVLEDEKKLAVELGPAYVAYLKAVKRWIPGLF